MSDTDYWITKGTKGESLSRKRKHTDRDCQYLTDENVRPYRAGDPDVPTCKVCAGDVDESEKQPDYSYFRTALDTDIDLDDDHTVSKKS